MSVVSICYVRFVRVFVLLKQFKNILNELMRYLQNRKLKPVLITFTVKNGSDLAERSNHLMKSFRTLLDRRRDYLKKGRGFNEFCKINGAMYSYENTYNEKLVNGIRTYICLHCSILDRSRTLV